MIVKYKLLNGLAKAPEKAGHDADPRVTAGFNLFSTAKVRINTNSVQTVATGISLEIPRDYYGILQARSGFASQTGGIINGGIIDPNYRGEILLIVNNPTEAIIDISVGQSIAQIIILPILDIELQEHTELSQTERDDQRFNSTELKTERNKLTE